jgi:5,10-methylenetetrahydromethanopterin reductase
VIPFGVSFDGFSPITEAVETAKLAESCGARSLWVAEHLGYRDSFLTAFAIAQGTQAARVVPTAISPYVRHPMPTVMALASLVDLVPNRVGIAIGVGNPMFLKESGVAIDRPLKVVRDYVAALRALMQGGPVNHEGLTFRLDGARLALKVEPPPIYLAPMGPQMLQLAGRIADGLVLSSGLTTPFVKRSLGIALDAARASGRNPARIHKASYLYFIAGGDTEDRHTKVRQKLAFLFRNQTIADNLRSSGLAIDHEAIMAAVARRDMLEAMRLVPPEAVDVFAISGDAAQCRRRLEAYSDAGLDEAVLLLIGTAEDRARSLQVVRSF